MAEFLTTRQLQEILHVDRTTIYRMAEAGRIPAVKIGNQWRFPRRSIEAWLKTQNSAAVAADAAPLPANGASVTMDRLLPVECVQKIQDAFADVLGVMMVVTDLEGRPLTAVSNACGLYELVQQSPAARERCRREWAQLASRPSLHPTLERGHLGLLYAGGLVRVGSELKAILIAGGIAPQQWPPSERELARLAEYLDVDERTLRAHSAEVHRLDAAAQHNVVGYVQRVADIIAHIITERNLLFGRLQHIAELSKF